jgi:hypothetical protein
MAQGEMDFSNAPWEAWPDAIDRLVYMPDGTTPVSDASWSARLVQNVGGAWQPVGDAVFFFGPDLPGIWAADGVKRNPTVATVAVEIYDGAGAMLYRGGGADAGQAQRASFQYTRANSIPPSPTDTLPVGLRAIIVPEPSTIALGVLGLGALLLFRRRK